MVYYELISFPCKNLIVLLRYCTYKIIIIIITCTCILLSRLILFCAYCYFNETFYISFGGSLEY